MDQDYYQNSLAQNLQIIENLQVKEKESNPSALNLKINENLTDEDQENK